MHRPFTFYYYFLDTCVFLSIVSALAISKLGNIRKDHGNVSIPFLAIGLSTLWFAVHFAGFTGLGTPWNLPLYFLSLFGL
jgi:hypothetical protein